MNTPQIIYNFLCRLEPCLKQGYRPFESFQIALGVESNYKDFYRLQLKLAEDIYKLADFIELEQPDIDIDRAWVNDIIKFLSLPINTKSDDFALSAHKLFPHVKNFIGSQIRIWNLVHGNQKNLDKDQMSSIKQKSEILIEEFIKNNELAPNVRAFLIKQLRKIIEAIDHYQIYGNEGLVEILDESIGHAFTNKNYEDFLKDDQSTTWKEYLLIISTVVTTSDSFVSLTNNIKNFLP